MTGGLRIGVGHRIGLSVSKCFDPDRPWASAMAADGPKVAAWIEKNIPDYRSVKGDDGKRVLEWSRGVSAGVFTLDTFLTKHGHHLSELPDDVWLEKAPTTNHRYAA